MSTGGITRKLTTVLAADVVGYSGLVAADDESTILRLRHYRGVMEQLIARHYGRPFGAAGDSLMAEFPSAVEAVRCGLEIQEELAALNREAPAGHAMQLRIGINVGEAIVEADSLYGDAVNIAARLEAIADAGGILISASAYEQIKNKISAEIESLGRRSLKNLPEPIGVFRVRVVGGIGALPAAVPDTDARRPAVASSGAGRWKKRAIVPIVAVLVGAIAIMAWDRFVNPQLQFQTFAAATTYPVPKEPSIVVLPFSNSSGIASQEYLSDGLSEDITTQLTRVAGLFVVGRDSAFSFKGRAVQAKFVGRQLGVRYVLQGSVRRADNKVRVSAYLVDAATDQTVWAVSQDRVLNDVFALQDEIAMNVVRSLKLKLRESDPGNSRQYVQYFAAYDTFLKGRELLGQPTKQNLLAARSLFEETARLDPNFAGGYAGISLTYSHFVRQRFSDSPPADIQEATRYGKIALGKDDRYALALLAMANAYLLERKQDEAVALAEAAHDAYPADANINGVLGLMLTFDGRPTEAQSYIDKAIELNRLEAFSASFYFFKMLAAYVDGKNDVAHEAYKKYQDIETSTEQAAIDKRIVCRRNCLAYAAAIKLQLSKQPDLLQQGGQQQLTTEAKALATKLTGDDPDYLGRLPLWTSLFKNARDGKRIEDDLKEALALR